MDMELFNEVIDQERKDAQNLWEIKQKIAGDMQL